MDAFEFIKSFKKCTKNNMYHGLINVTILLFNSRQQLGPIEIYMSKTPPPRVISGNMTCEYVWLHVGHYNELIMLVNSDGTVTKLKQITFRSQSSIEIKEDDDTLYNIVKRIKKGLT